MLRSSFFAAGLFVALWGVSFLFIDKVVLTAGETAQREEGFRGLRTSAQVEQPPEIDPPDWAAFSLMSVGAVTMLYAVALPQRNGN